MTAERSPITFPLQGNVVDAMHPGVVWSPPDAGVAKLAAIMLTHGIHDVVIGGSPDDAAPLIVTDLDLVRAALERPGAGAAEIAGEPIASVNPYATLEEAVKIMAERYVAHLLVSEPGTGAPVGVISSFDVAAVLAGHEPWLARMLRPAQARPLASAATLAQAWAAEVMHAGIITCAADAPLATVARAMASNRVHCVAIAGVDRRRELFTWGLIGDLDVVVALHRGAYSEPAAAIAAGEPLAVEENESLERVAALMVEHDTSHVVVVGHTGLPTGIISTLDVAEILAGAA